VEVVGSSIVVRGEQVEGADGHQPFSLRERLEEFIRLPDDVDPRGVKATYRHGTLELRARRRKPLRRRVPIERGFLVGSTPSGC
jgi:HSP20 family molecular chaperone IbpA